MASSLQKASAGTVNSAPGADRTKRVVETLRLPRIRIDAFSQTPEVAVDLERALSDRRMSRTQVSLRAGGIAAAVELYQHEPTPSLLIVESPARGGDLHAAIDALADVCDASTKVIVIGPTNDISLYRELIQRGVSEYLVAPLDPIAFIGVISRLYDGAKTSRLGSSFAFVGAKGGVGSSTIAQNTASVLSRAYRSEVILADLDLPFGSASLGFNLMDQAQGIADALQDVSRLDSVLLDRLLAKREDHLSVLTAPASLEKFQDVQEGESAFAHLLDVAQSNVPYVVLDMPHVWTSWAKKTLLGADEVVITVAPDLISLRNAKNLVELLRKARPNDGPPKLVLNQVGVPKRAEVDSKKFSAALDLEPIACIGFEPLLFSTALNEGRMVADVAPKSNAAKTFTRIAHAITGRSVTEDQRPSRFGRLWRR